MLARFSDQVASMLEHVSSAFVPPVHTETRDDDVPKNWWR